MINQWVKKSLLSLAILVSCLGLFGNTVASAQTKPVAPKATIQPYSSNLNCQTSYSSYKWIKWCFQIQGTGTYVDKFLIGGQQFGYFPSICFNVQVTGPNGWRTGVWSLCRLNSMDPMYFVSIGINSRLTPGSYCATFWTDWGFWLGGRCDTVK